ncbi:PUA-like domain-containing protein [Xylariaceae sp. FL1272]|nr:PUA-like domain-containing protein [Xylariaceae sp. FL1272]
MAGQSREPLTSYESITEFDYEKSALLMLSDSVRAVLRDDDVIRAAFRSDNVLNPEIRKMGAFLEAMSRDEQREHPTLDLETIEYARLDKLLAEFLQLAENIVRKLRDRTYPSEFLPEDALRIRVDISHGKNLYDAWRRRFRQQWFMMDQHRCAILVAGGRLKNVCFDNSLGYDLGKWQTSEAAGPVSEVEGNQNFDSGHWWLNITCAERDGIVGSSLEKPTKGRYGIAVLPLLTGSEEYVRTNTIKYIRHGTSSDMHTGLIPQVGRQIRILRGHTLKSIYAPEAGLRYDGLYTIRQYGMKYDEKLSAHRLELTLERVPNQRPCEELRQIPKPSQLDDFFLYEKLEGEKIKLMQGEAKYLEWTLRRREEKADLESWQAARLFRASLSEGSW